MQTNNSRRRSIRKKTQTKDKEKQGPFCCYGERCELLTSAMFGGTAADSDERRLNLDGSFTAHCQSCNGYFHVVTCGNEAQTCCKMCDSSDSVDVTAGDDGREMGK